MPAIQITTDQETVNKWKTMPRKTKNQLKKRFISKISEEVLADELTKNSDTKPETLSTGY